MSEAVIVLDDLSKTFGSVHAVHDLSLQIESGSIFGFLGPNGAGKTTTMRMLCGLTHPTGGHATIEGADVWKDRQRVRTKFGYVPQRFSLYRDLTVMENFRFFGGAYGLAKVLGQDLSDPNTLFWADRQFVFGSFDGGSTFENLFTRSDGAGWISRGRLGLDERWDPDLGLCLDYDVRAGAPVRARTVAGFAPLIAGDLAPERAAALVDECARLAGEAGAELDRQVRAADAGSGPAGQLALDQ